MLKAGAAYVPLDPEYPAERVGFVLEDTAAPLLVTERARCSSGCRAHAATTVCLDRGRDGLDSLPATNPEPLATPENLAYVIYTSGSTGRPKGVQVEHRHVARLFTATDALVRLRPDGRLGAAALLRLRLLASGSCGAPSPTAARLVISPLWTTRSPQALAELVGRASG